MGREGGRESNHMLGSSMVGDDDFVSPHRSKDTQTHPRLPGATLKVIPTPALGSTFFISCLMERRGLSLLVEQHVTAPAHEDHILPRSNPSSIFPVLRKIRGAHASTSLKGLSLCSARTMFPLFMNFYTANTISSACKFPCCRRCVEMDFVSRF
jgi:hypothetical protein